MKGFQVLNLQEKESHRQLTFPRRSEEASQDVWFSVSARNKAAVWKEESRVPGLRTAGLQFVLWSFSDVWLLPPLAKSHLDAR